jgi:hypothetical protein
MKGTASFDCISEQACRDFEAIVGPDNVTTDPALRIAYVGRGYDRQVFWFNGDCRKPSAVVMPKSTDEVVRVIKTCNRYNIPFIPESTYGMSFSSAQHRDDCIVIDLKRMNKMEIDDRNMFCVVEPGVVYHQLHGEILKRGLAALVPGGGGQVSVLANAFLCGMAIYNYRISILSQRRLNGVEWVTPQGEVYRLGSLMAGDDHWYWQDGAGPNVTGFLKGLASWAGGMGIVTRISYKLYPFQTEPMVPTGLGPKSCLKLPPRVKFYTVSFEDEPSVRKAMRELAKARIGACINRIPAYWRTVSSANGDESFSNTFWNRWNKETEESVAKSRLLRVMIVGYASLKQVEYEEKVLQDICTENKGTLLRSGQTDETVFFAANSTGMWKATGVFGECNALMESPRCIERTDDLYRQRTYEMQKQYPNDFLPQKGEYPWYLSIEFGRIYYSELQVWPYGANLDPTSPDWDEGIMKRYLKWRFSNGLGLILDTGALSFFDGQVQPLREIARTAHHYDRWLDLFKKEFDPALLAAPGHPFMVDKLANGRHPDTLTEDLRKQQKKASSLPWLGNS